MKKKSSVLIGCLWINLILASQTMSFTSVSDSFDGTIIDDTKWEVTAPGSSSVYQDDALFVTNDGKSGKLCIFPIHFGPGSGIGSRFKLSGDFDIQVDFNDFEAPYENLSQAFLNVYQDGEHALHIKRVRKTDANGNEEDLVRMVYKFDSGIPQGNWYVDFPQTSGRLKIVRTGSTIATYYDRGDGNGFNLLYSKSGLFIGDVAVSMRLLGEGASVVYDNFIVNYANSIVTNTQPYADAGPDQTVNEYDLVILDGSNSCDPQLDELTYTWTQVAGPQASPDLTDPVNPSFIAPEVEEGGATLTFELVVDDGELTSDPDWVDITLKNVNHAPITDAGDDQTVQEDSLVALDGSGSYDPDNDIITYSWVQTAGSPVTLSGSNTAYPSFTAPFVGSGGETLTFKLLVSDGVIEVSDTVNVVIENVNHPPSANAGPDQTRNEGSQISLDGSGSSDPDSDPLTFQWDQVAGPGVSLDLTDPSLPTFIAPSVSPGGATLIFQLIVNDGIDESEPDEVIITVLNVNDPPICNNAQAKPDRLWPPNHKLVQIEIVGVTDPNNEEVTITIDSVTQDEPVNDTGDGDTVPDAVIQGEKVLLRAERAGDSNGRVYQIVFTADDGSGGICSGTVAVCVPHDRRDTSCVDDHQIYDSLQP